MAQWSLPILEISGSNPVIVKFNTNIFTVEITVEKTTLNKKRSGMAL